MEPQAHILGAPMAAIDGATAAYMLRTLAGRPLTSSGSLLTLADRLDEAAPHASASEQPRIRDVARIAREMAPHWPDGMAGVAALSSLASTDVALAREAGVRRGIEMAAAVVKQRADDYHNEHGFCDPSTGVTEYPGNGDETMLEWAEIEEAIRALTPAPSDALAALLREAEERGAQREREALTGEDAQEAFLRGFYGSDGGFTQSIRDGLDAIRARTSAGEGGAA